MKNKKGQNKIYLQPPKTSNGSGVPTTQHLSPMQGLNRPVKKRDFKNRAGSMLTIPTYTRKNLKLTNNVASLVKKYANYIFNELKLDKNKDQIKF